MCIGQIGKLFSVRFVRAYMNRQRLCVCVCVDGWGGGVIYFSIIIICNSVCISNLSTTYSGTFGKGWVGRDCLYFIGTNVFCSFSLRELTCTHCVDLPTLNTQGFVWKFLMRHI